jgi:hypothetical protein
MADDGRINDLFDAALKIAMQEQVLMGQLRQALEEHDNDRALTIARRLTGLEAK